MSNVNARKGALFETDLLTYLRTAGYPVERLPKTGKEDECDLVVSSGAYPRSQGARFEVIEAKNRTRLDLPQWIRERDIGVVNFAKHRSLPVSDVSGVVVIKRRMARIGQAFVLTTVDDYYAVNFTPPNYG